MLNELKKVQVIGVGDIPEDTNSDETFERLANDTSDINDLSTDTVVTQMFSSDYVKVRSIGLEDSVREIHDVFKEFENKYDVELKNKNISKMTFVYTTELSEEEFLEIAQNHEGGVIHGEGDVSTKIDFEEFEVHWFRTQLIHVQFIPDMSKTVEENLEYYYSHVQELFDESIRNV